MHVPEGREGLREDRLDDLRLALGPIQVVQALPEEVALEVARELGPGKRVVTVICDGWERYASMQNSLGLIPGLDFII